MVIMSSQYLSCLLIPLWCPSPLLTLSMHSAVKWSSCYCLCSLENNHGFRWVAYMFHKESLKYLIPWQGILQYLWTESKLRKESVAYS